MGGASIIRVGGACAILGVAAALAGAAVGALHGLGGQEIPLDSEADFLALAAKQSAYVAREWLFLAYAVLAIGEGIGLYFLTRAARTVAVCGVVAFSSGILLAVVQDAAVVGFVTSFPGEYSAADASARRSLESVARMTAAMIGAQQTVANVLLGIGGALFSLAIIRTRVASRWLGMFGLAAAAAGVFYGLVTAAAPRVDDFAQFAEHAFGLVVFWDLAVALVLLGYREVSQPS